MSETGKIRMNFDALKQHYPTYKTLPPALQKYMDGLNDPVKKRNIEHEAKGEPKEALNTPCCIQVSHALNKAGQRIPPSSFRRANALIESNYYLQAVDELEQYLSGAYGRGEEIKKAPNGKVRSIAEMKQHINGKQGILVFRNSGAGHHTELWDKTRILQDGNAVSGGGAVMNETNIFGQARVLFWEVVAESAGTDPVPEWLKGWWKVYDGETYYYHFTDQHLVTWTQTAPKNVLAPPVKQQSNEAVVKISQNSTVIVLEWNESGGGQTIETFTRAPTNYEFMNGVSNRYAPLTATKMK